MAPGFAFAAAITSRKSLYGWLSCATIAIGEVPTSITGARSFSVSKASVGMSAGFTACVSKTTPNVYPSGAAAATTCVPIEPDAPPRFSTMNCWPSCCVRCAAKMRATWSTEPPGGNTAMILTGFDGHADWA